VAEQNPAPSRLTGNWSISTPQSYQVTQGISESASEHAAACIAALSP
jgi:hypothetical protein